MAFGAALADIERQLGYRPTSAPPISDSHEEAPYEPSRHDHPEQLSPALHEELDASVTMLRPVPSSLPVSEDESQPAGEREEGTETEAAASLRRLWFAAAGTAAVLAMASLAVVYGLRDREDPPPPSPPPPSTMAALVSPRGVTGLVGTLEGGSATFVWEPSQTAAEHQVSYLLTPIGGPDTRAVSVDGLAYTIDDVAALRGAGGELCVEVRAVLRSNGRMSPESETATACAREDQRP